MSNYCFFEKTQQVFDCLLGGALGDSLGADIEFSSLEEIRNRFPGGADNCQCMLG